MRVSAAIAGLLVTTAASYAQAPPSAPQAPPVQGTVRCAPAQPPAVGQGAAPSQQQTTGQSRESLSDRLAQSGGVMCPPTEHDQQMQKPPPEEGKTPVIPPPGSPGGDPTLRPK
jgi:hypothetical protein